jgi:hypothetical protein
MARGKAVVDNVEEWRVSFVSRLGGRITDSFLYFEEFFFSWKGGILNTLE